MNVGIKLAVAGIAGAGIGFVAADRGGGVDDAGTAFGALALVGGVAMAGISMHAATRGTPLISHGSAALRAGAGGVFAGIGAAVLLNEGAPPRAATPSSSSDATTTQTNTGPPRPDGSREAEVEHYGPDGEWLGVDHGTLEG